MIFSSRSKIIASVSDLKKSRKFAFDNYDIKVKRDKQISLRGVEICIDTRYVINLSAYEPAIPDKAGQAQLFVILPITLL